MATEKSVWSKQSPGDERRLRCIDGRKGLLFVVGTVVSSEVSQHLDVKEAEQEAV